MREPREEPGERLVNGLAAVAGVLLTWAIALIGILLTLKLVETVHFANAPLVAAFGGLLAGWVSAMVEKGWFKARRDKRREVVRKQRVHDRRYQASAIPEVEALPVEVPPAPFRRGRAPRS